jgi:hypothetical protein
MVTFRKYEMRLTIRKGDIHISLRMRWLVDAPAGSIARQNVIMLKIEPLVASLRSNISSEGIYHELIVTIGLLRFADW